MELSFSPAEEAFRTEVRAFIAEAAPRLPPGLDEPEDATRSKADYLVWHKLLYAKGWIAPNWPKEYGGAGWTVTQRYIFGEECAHADMPRILPFGINMVGPVIYNFGSEAQKKKYLPRILSGEDWWCQGYSEPGAGSDLASLRLRAARDGDGYVVNGQKTWTTLAQYADMIFCLVRTDPDAKPQEGISFLLIDMKSPGITVRPILVLNGAPEVNEIFFDNVKVPAENLVGAENKGWTYAKFLLVNERSSLAVTARSKRELEKLKQAVRLRPVASPDFSGRLAAAEIALLALEYTELRALAGESGGQPAGAESSITKIRGTEIQQEIARLALEAAGYHALPDARRPGANATDVPGHAAAHYFNLRKASIYGGSNEIQRNIIAKSVLGL